MYLKSYKKSDVNITICSDILKVGPTLGENLVDLLFIDPPYNLNKHFGNTIFRQKSASEYESLFDHWINSIKHTLKKTSSIYVCSDWKTSQIIYKVLDKYFIIRNRITWEREKGRGALSNWKNCSEDIWFATISNKYTFNLNHVKLKRNVIAPYKIEGHPKDWNSDKQGKFRMTSPSNLWTDITIPFWSMPENTDHKTQKPEKLLAKILLASSNKGDLILDPFVGSGTTSVVAKKLKRKYIGIELNEEYCCLTEKRLKMAQENNTIQGYEDGIFYHRNFKLLNNK
ncbi:MAG: DNA methyltransferase [Flavobacteriaceae bacterium]|nr:DNA methyltransferase [Flavobacteriaceae bacterium]